MNGASLEFSIVRTVEDSSLTTSQMLARLSGTSRVSGRLLVTSQVLILSPIAITFFHGFGLCLRRKVVQNQSFWLIAGVRFPGLIHPGLIGTAPSKELLDIWNKREKALVDDGENALTLGKHLHTRPLALLPQTQGALLGKVEKGSKDWKRIAAEACRTIPGRENGGNCDIKNLSRGCRVYFPVFIEGANLSMGDMHFSQGDGEVSFCGAIEMSGFLELK